MCSDTRAPIALTKLAFWKIVCLIVNTVCCAAFTCCSCNCRTLQNTWKITKCIATFISTWSIDPKSSLIIIIIKIINLWWIFLIFNNFWWIFLFRTTNFWGIFKFPRLNFREFSNFQKINFDEFFQFSTIHF